MKKWIKYMSTKELKNLDTKYFSSEDRSDVVRELKRRARRRHI